MRLTRSSLVSLHLLRCSVAAIGILTASASADPPASVPLPEAPEGIHVRSLACFGTDDQEPVRIAAQPGTGRLFVLGGGGDVTAIDPKSGTMRRVLEGKDYIDRPADQTLNIPLPVDAKVVNAPITLRSTLCLGIAFDRQGRLYVTANVQVPGQIFVNRVCLYRTSPVGIDGGVPRPERWTWFDHPYGVGGFNHGAGRIAQGPDGMIYLGSGSRTDHGEAGDQPNMSRLGEGPHPDVPGGPGLTGAEFTACILRFDPAKGQQSPVIYSRGNRNPFGFDWDDKGRLIDAEHGPMADHPEELNWIQRGEHYGFPYVFGDREAPVYTDGPKAPAGTKFISPIENVGPAGILGITPLFSLAPHSAPGGLIFYQTGKLPHRFDRSFFLARFGNLVNYNRIGFDVLNIRLKDEGGKLVAHTERFLDGLGRPIDLCVGDGKLYVVEYCRQSETVGQGSAGYRAGGRVLEISASP